MCAWSLVCVGKTCARDKSSASKNYEEIKDQTPIIKPSSGTHADCCQDFEMLATDHRGYP